MIDFISKSLTRKMVLLLLVLSLVPMFILALIGYQMSEQMRSDFLDKLEQQFNEKAIRVDGSIEQRIFEMDTLSHHVLFQELTSDLPNVQVQDIDDELSTRYLEYAERTAYVDTILEIKLFDNDGMELFSLYNTHLGADYTVESIDTITDTQIMFDFDEKLGRMVKAEAPIMSNDHSQRLGLLLFVTDMGSFDPILLDRSGLKETGEAYFVNTEKIMASESRFIEDAAFNQEVDTFGVRQCLENNSEVRGDTYFDYREEPIIGYSKCMLENGVVLLVEADLQEITSSLDVFQNQFIVVLISTGLAVFFISISIGRKIAKPVTNLSHFANELANENFDAKLDLKEKDEIGQLGGVMSNMGEKLSQKINQLNKTNALLERMSVIGELTSRLVHDLKNPLSIINMTTQMMKMETSDEKGLNRIEKIDESYNSIMRQIQDTLDYIKEGKFTFREISLSGVISKAIKMTEIPDKVKLNQELKEITISADNLKLQVVFSNLLRNAVEAMEGKGEISIRVVDMKDKVKIEFEDSGSGIPPKALDKIFDPLFTTKSTGTGLGLVSCKKIIEQHNGEIKIKNNPTTFTIILPKGLVESK